MQSRTTLICPSEQFYVMDESFLKIMHKLTFNISNWEKTVHLHINPLFEEDIIFLCERHRLSFEKIDNSHLTHASEIWFQ
jgi:hypothetical protein